MPNPKPTPKKSTFEEVVDRVNKALGMNKKPDVAPITSASKGADVDKQTNRADAMAYGDVDPTPTPTPSPTPKPKKKKY